MARICRHVDEHAARYLRLEEGKAATARLLRLDRRSYSHLLEFELSASGGGANVIVKIPVTARATEGVPGHRGSTADRPRVFPLIDAEHKSAFEHRALVTIEHHFARLNDPRFEAIGVLDYLPEWHAIVMVAKDHQTLRNLALRRLGRRSMGAREGDLGDAFENAGAWLRAYHRIPPPQPADVLATRAEFDRFTAELTTSLRRLLGHAGYFSAIGRRMRAGDLDASQAEFPLGLSHGDFAMRNVLVGSDHAVTVLDSLARYRAPIYRDVAFFLTDLAYSRLAACGRLSLGYLAAIDRYRSAFLHGYFGATLGAHQRDVVRLFEAQALLERWTSVAWSRASGGRRLRIELRMLSLLFRTLVSRRT